jgi:ATP-dependent exoDNAse (exonuclease V) alpha subunit
VAQGIQTETDEPMVELAYTITVHKSQGSDFEYVSSSYSKQVEYQRELIYTK